MGASLNRQIDRGHIKIVRIKNKDFDPKEHTEIFRKTRFSKRGYKIIGLVKRTSNGSFKPMSI